MTNLDLNALGVSEMNVAEMQNVDGGSFWGIIGTAIAIIGVCTGNPLAAFAGCLLGGYDAINGDS